MTTMMTVVLNTHGRLGAMDGGLHQVPTDVNGWPPPMLLIDVNAATPTAATPGQDPLEVPPEVVTLYRKRRTAAEGPAWAYIQPPANGQEPK